MYHRPIPTTIDIVCELLQKQRQYLSLGEVATEFNVANHCVEDLPARFSGRKRRIEDLLLNLVR